MNRMRTRVKLLAGLVATMAALLASMLILVTPSSAATVTVDISNYAFNPATLTVPVGTTVTWTNEDTAPHTVTSKSGGPLNSPNLSKGDSWSFTFTTPGSYEYFCAIHPDMVGKVIVTSDSTTTSTTMPMATTTTMPMGTSGTSGTGYCPSGGALSAVLSPFVTHVEKGHLEEPLPSQVGDILNLGQYVSTHTALAENMVAPVFSTILNVLSGSVSPFVTHVEKGHLQEPLASQVGDILNVGQYVTTHTVLVETMAAPLLDPVSGNC
jgi:plastocyanin